MQGQAAEWRFGPTERYPPRHLAERILTSKAALEGERKQVTVLFADLKGSMELLADRDPEEARKVLDPVLERMMEAVDYYLVARGRARRSRVADRCGHRRRSIPRGPRPRRCLENAPACRPLPMS